MTDEQADLSDDNEAEDQRNSPSSLIRRLADDDTKEKVADAARRGLSQASRAGKRAMDSAGQGIDKGVGAVTLRDYRESLDARMAQIVEVLSVHEAEIAALRKRVAELEKELGG